MRIAIPATKGMVSGPGEAEEVVIYESEPIPAIVDRYANPALTAISAPGIRMLRSAIDRNSTAIIVAEIGPHAFDYAKGRLDLFNGSGMSTDDAVKRFISKNLQTMSEATHPLHKHH